jgi:hypothetical protein
MLAASFVVQLDGSRSALVRHREVTQEGPSNERAMWLATRSEIYARKVSGDGEGEWIWAR